MWEFHTGQRIAAFSRDKTHANEDALGISPRCSALSYIACTSVINRLDNLCIPNRGRYDLSGTAINTRNEEE